MRRVLAVGAAALLAPLLAVAGPADAGTDISAPAVGSCFEMTVQEVRGTSNANPPVDCSEQHTTMTFHVVTYDEAPDWNDESTYEDEVYDQCRPAWIEAHGGKPKALQRSAYTWYWLLPTPAQREAGAAWVRCELVLRGGSVILPLPQNVELDGLPVPDSVAKCREGRRTDYAVTTCSRTHQLRSRHSLIHPAGPYPGVDRMVRWTIRRCEARMGDRNFGYYEYPTLVGWENGLRYSICFKTTRD